MEDALSEGFCADTEDSEDGSAWASSREDLFAGGGYGDVGCYRAVEYGYMKGIRGASIRQRGYDWTLRMGHGGTGVGPSYS